MSSQNLDQIAWDYLMGSPRDHDALGSELVNTGAATVFPLLRAGLQTVQDFNPVRTQGVARTDRQAAESIWIYQIAEPLLKSIYTIVNAIGQPAYDALCRALWEQDERFKVLSAIVLLQEKQISSRTAKQVQDAFNSLALNDRTKKYYMESGIFILLSHILAQGGDPKHQQVLREWASNHQMSLEQVLEVSRNTGLKFLLYRGVSE
jgi:hypothetical protein